MSKHEMQNILNKIYSTIENYRNLDDILVFQDKETINGMMKNLSSDLFFLGEYLDDSRLNYYRSYMKYINQGKSSTEAEKRAKNDNPEKRMLEGVLNRANKVFESMRSNQSFLKKE